MNRIPSRVAEEGEAMDYFPSGQLVRASTEEVGNGHASDVRRTHSEYHGKPRSSSSHASSKASLYAENKV
jgi:hypothetical protein